VVAASVAASEKRAESGQSAAALENCRNDRRENDMDGVSSGTRREFMKQGVPYLISHGRIVVRWI
jgi:hypothetical protein